MNKQDFKKLLFPDDRVYSPASVVKRFNNALTKFGAEKVLKNSNFDKARELWVSAVFLMAFQDMTEPKIEYWLRPCYDRWPDSYGVFFANNPVVSTADDENRFYIEVSEWTEFDKKSLSDLISQKMQKNYPPNHTLLIYVKKVGVNINMQEVAQIIKNSGYNPTSIFILTSKKSDTCDHSLVSIYPEEGQMSFYLKDLLQKHQRPMDGMFVERRLDREIRRSPKTEFPLPDLE